MFKLFDTVKTIKALPEVGIAADTVGTIVEVYDQPYRAYEVEFANEHGETIAMLALTAEQVVLDKPFAAMA